jgi:MoaA/NifB/PqqE/SkfB family radical SAM enzyme
MNYSYSSIKSVEIEISTYCNAACPQCPRNNYGGKTINSLPLINWSLEQLQSVIEEPFIKQLDLIYFCGTYGDPLMNNQLTDMCSWLKQVNPNLKIGIHTNGGAGKKETFIELAKTTDFIAFGLDGLEDTNHLYRRNTKWDIIMSNANAFINAGGYAIWDFIVFQHNQHQVEDARKLSNQLNFKEFNVKKTSRFFNKNHELVDYIDVLDNNGNKEYKLYPPTNEYLNTAYELVRQTDLNDYIKNTKITCYFAKHNQLYIGADGNVVPCGLLHDRLYGLEAEQNSDHTKILQMMNDVGGKKYTNVFHTSLESIVDGPWFDRLKHSWTHDRLERCAIYCGESIRLLKDQNTDITYK